MASQIREYAMLGLQSAIYCCIIADEWTCKHSNKGYCSVSLRYVTDDLKVSTYFLGYIRISSTSASDVKDAIMKALTRQLPALNLSKITAQTYDGANVMQGHLSGVQHRIRVEHCPFALNLHCINHQVQLSVKMMNKGHKLVSRITDNCMIIVKLINYSPKRNAGLERVKNTIKQGINAPPSYYTNLKKKVLDFCVTRWTVRASSLSSIDQNHLALLKLFCDILMDRTERNSLNAEKLQEISGLVKYMQSFEFIFGIKLSFLLYHQVGSIAMNLQGDKVCISDAMQFLRNLVAELEEKKDNFGEFWEEVEEKRAELNEKAQNLQSLQECGYYTEIEEASCPRATMRVMRGVVETEEEAIESYWNEHYVGAFQTILDDLNDRIDSPLIKVFVEIEQVLLNSINSPLLPIKIDMMNEAYGSQSGHGGAPLEGLTVEELRIQLAYVRNLWLEINGDKRADSFHDIVSLVKESVKEHIPLRSWVINAKYVLIMLRLVLVATGTSSFAERTFSLSRRLKTWLRAGMDDTTFDNLGLLAWYSDNIDSIVDSVKIGNKYIEMREGRKMIYGAEFTADDFIN